MLIPRVWQRRQHRSLGFTLPTCFINVQTAIVQQEKLSASPPPLPGSGRQLGWLHWPGTHRVTRIYLQHSSISPRTRGCWHWETLTWILHRSSQ